jgi:hypothetical protein
VIFHFLKERERERERERKRDKYVSFQNIRSLQSRDKLIMCTGNVMFHLLTSLEAATNLEYDCD